MKSGQELQPSCNQAVTIGHQRLKSDFFRTELQNPVTHDDNTNQVANSNFFFLIFRVSNLI